MLTNADLQRHTFRLHRELNRQTVNLAESYQSHRSTIMRCVSRAKGLAIGTSHQSCKIAWLGAGNCNDIDFDEVLSLFEDFHLIDADADALNAGVDRNAVDRDRITTHAPVDVAAPLLSLSKLTNNDSTLEQLQMALEPTVPDCDVVVSGGLLSQLMFTLSELHKQVPCDTELLLRYVQAVRLGHVTRMQSMLRPGGVGIITCELIASDSAPELLQRNSTDQSELQGLAKRLAQENKLFMGMNPALILNDMRAIDVVSDGVMSLPWVWNCGKRSYLVVAIMFVKNRPS